MSNSYACLAKPGQSNLRTCVALSQEGPVGIGVISVPSPLRKSVQSVRYRHVAIATNVPRGCWGSRSRTFALTHGHLLQSQRDVESLFVEVRGRVDLSDNVLFGSVCGVEPCSI